MPDIPSQGDEKPSSRPSSSLRGGSSLRGRGRGRGLSSSSSTTGGPSLPSERLTSIRNRPTSTPSAATTPTTGGSKLVFKPTIPARRNKKEPSSLLTNTLPEAKREKKDEKRPDRGRGRGMMRARERPALIESVSGPFAQGPALISSVGRRGMTGTSGPMPSAMGGLGDASGVKAEGGATGDSKPGGSEDVELVMLTDHNALDNNSAVEVQTEEMAIQAVEEMNRLRLDFSVAEFFSGDCKTTEGELAAGLDEKMMVFQIPQLPEFDLAPEIIQRRLASKQKKLMKQRIAAEKIKEDIKPSIVDIDAAADNSAINVDVKPDIRQLEMMEDVKPDLSKLAIEDDKDDSEPEDEDQENDDQADGRVGTLVVLKSGAVRMKIGDIVLDVSRGADCQFMRGLLAIDQREPHSAFLLGNVDQQFLCTPDLDSIPDLEQQE
ncbi:hypothetical protein LPJ64_004900 [Coemansia asiatica]|uniref:DNA-directed RNA polymerase III subunit RPC4 n=1 Tax=Coemansia asiatica TaxID=1052880 RepID=A0A9W7XI99_9FUNG|nr:hypothetical protein LPJ64_004900 [Coemansia asiatica]